MLSLDAQLSLPVIAANECLTLLGDDDGAVLTTAHTLDDELIRCDSFEGWYCWLVRLEHLAQSGLSVGARAPRVDVPTVGDEGAV